MRSPVWSGDHDRTRDNMRKFTWIELIAFDADADDYGVAEVIGAMNDQPEVLSFLLYSIEFLHTHAEDSDGLIPSECTSYAGRESSTRGRRQEWTRGQLRGLVGTLQQRGIAVIFALFDLTSHVVGEGRAPGRWLMEHPELQVVTSEGEPWESVLNPLASCADGTAYRDLFAQLVGEVIDYYGFDGLHGADGFSSGRLPIWRADFSASTIARFEAWRGSAVVGRTAPEIAHWVWGRARLEWIRFHAAEWADFWTRVSAVVHERGGMVILNNAWTRDPFEALYRFGVDYRELVGAGIDGFIMETGSAAIELVEPLPDLSPLPSHMAMVALTAATVPDTLLAGLVAVRDTEEGWDVVHVAPMMHERDVRLLGGLLIGTGDGVTVRPALGAALYCLSDGIAPELWRWMDEVRRSLPARSESTGRSVALLYDPDVLDVELEAFIANRAAHTHALFAEVLRRGVDMHEVRRPRDSTTAGTVCLLRADLYPRDVVAGILADHARVVRLEYDGEGVWHVLLDARGREPQRWRFVDPTPTHVGHEVADSWVHELAMGRPPEDAWDRLTEILQTGIVGGRPDPSVQERWRITSEGAEVLVYNSRPNYANARLEVSAEATGFRQAPSRFPAFPKRTEGHLVAPLPPNGVVVIRMDVPEGRAPWMLGSDL